MKSIDRAINVLPDRYRHSYREDQAKKRDDRAWYTVPWLLQSDAEGRLWLNPNDLLGREERRTGGGALTIRLCFIRPDHLMAIIPSSERYIWSDIGEPNEGWIPVAEIAEV